MHYCHYISQLYWNLLLILVTWKEILDVKCNYKACDSLNRTKGTTFVCVWVCVSARAWVLSKGRDVRLFQKSGRHKKLDSWSTTTSSLSHFKCTISEAGNASLPFSSVRATVRKHIIISSFENVLFFVSYFFFPPLLFSFIHSYILSFIHSSFLSFPTLITFYYFFYQLYPSPLLLSPSVPFLM